MIYTLLAYVALGIGAYITYRFEKTWSQRDAEVARLKAELANKSAEWALKESAVVEAFRLTIRENPFDSYEDRIRDTPDEMTLEWSPGHFIKRIQAHERNFDYSIMDCISIARSIRERLLELYIDDAEINAMIAEFEAMDDKMSGAAIEDAVLVTRMNKAEDRWLSIRRKNNVSRYPVTTHSRS